MAHVIPFPVIIAQPRTANVSERYQPDYTIQTGEKYEHGLDIKAIAKRIRSDIKTQVQAGALPKATYSVTISRFSGGQSLRVSISGVQSPYLMLNPERVAVAPCG